ncbi:MAG: arsenate reductase ArsC, partial [Pseudomonadota bacterium]
SDAERLLMRKNMPTHGYRSKSWDEFAQGDAPQMNLIISVCCSTAGEIWPIWPGTPLTAHWGIDDPATAPRDQIDLAFQMTYHRLSSRINSFLALPFETMAPAELTPPLARIGSS